MSINIYQEIKYGQRKIWIISDLHFNHRFLIENKIRPLNYQKLTIDNWKEFVGEEDIVFVLGDIIFARDGELRQILKQLPGYKILILGNHDKHATQWYINHGFQEVYSEYIIPGLEPILLTHKPNIAEGFAYNICGHLHKYINGSHRRNDVLNITYKTRVYSLELEGYMPILLEDILDNTHTSYQYFKTIGFNKIKIRYYLYHILKFLKII